ncbi:universal stress protein [Halalkalicoccus tibetensis]|uniref:Universal stress protein n=1 Tax=Halalkalicoccus tibetensis TaxID=175632 RepID=A0ABD5V3P2_9EURY
MYDTILVPTDGSDVAELAVERAIDLAETYGATLHTLYVVDTDAMDLSLGTEQVDRIRAGKFGEMEEVERKARDATDRVVERAEESGVPTVEHIAAGRPHTVITSYADEHDADMIVMGSHGRSGVSRVLLGSVAERVLRTTHRPVLVVDARQDD